MLKDKKNEVWNIVEIARNKERPNVRFYIENIFDDFIEFHGDRNFRDDKAVIGGIASIDKISVTVIGVNKGKNVKENINVCIGSKNIKKNSCNISIVNIENVSELRAIQIERLDINNLYIFSLYNIICMLTIADVILIPEAKYTSYSNTLVSNFLDFGKDILVIPGDIWNKNCFFSNFLIREGANVILNINDLNIFL